MTDSAEIQDYLLSIVKALGDAAGNPRLDKFVLRQYHKRETPTRCADLLASKLGVKRFLGSGE